MGDQQTFNAQGVEEPMTGQAVPDGYYLVQVKGIKPWNAKNCRAWGLQMQIVDGPFINSSVKDNLFFSPKGLSKAVMVLRRMGIDVPQGQVSINSDSLIGKQCVVLTETEENDGFDQAGNPRVYRKNVATYAGYFPASQWTQLQKVAVEQKEPRRRGGALQAAAPQVTVPQQAEPTAEDELPF